MNARFHPYCPAAPLPLWSAALAQVEPGERFNVASHAAGAVLNGIVTVALVQTALLSSGGLRALGLAAYGFSLTAAYVASVLYHSSRGEARRRYRKFDRSAIYVALAGLYTPLALTAMPRHAGLPVLAAVWGVAALGVFFELKPAGGGARRSCLLYLVMGWGILFIGRCLVISLTPAGLAWLVAGGVLYSGGAMLLGCRRFPRNHETWHVLALAGNACHLVMMLRYVC